MTDRMFYEQKYNVCERVCWKSIHC